MPTNVGSATGYLDLDITGFLANLKTAQSVGDTSTKNMVTKIGNNIQGVGKNLSSVGSSLTKNVTLPLAAVATVGFNVATSFEKNMSNVKAISKTTGSEFKSLRDEAISLGSSTAFSANEVAGAMTEMAKAGWSSQQILDGMSGVLDAAAASGEELGTVSTIVADAVTGFGLKAKDSARIADLLTQAANSGTIGITDLGESFKYVAPVATSMGISVEDTTTAISAMSMAGIKGSQAGTALRTILARMSKPIDAVKDSMDELGLSIVNQDGSFKSLDTIVSEMRKKFSGLTAEQKSYHAVTLAGMEGQSALLSILGLSQAEYDKLGASMDNATGVAKETAAVMQDNVKSKIEQLGGSLESLAIRLGDIVIPMVQNFVIELTGLVDKFTNMDAEQQKAILKYGALAIAIGPVLTATGTLISSFGILVTTLGKIPAGLTMVSGGFKTIGIALKNVPEGFALARAGMSAFAMQASPLGAALAGVLSPVILIVAAIAVLVAAFVTLWKTNEGFRNAITGIWNQIKETVTGFCDGIVQRINALGFDFDNILQVLAALWIGFCNLLAPIFTGAFQVIANVLKLICGIITGILDIFIGLFTGNWDQLWLGIKEVFGATWDYIVANFNAVGKTLVGIVDTIAGWFGSSWEGMLQATNKFFTDAWNGIVKFFTDTYNDIITWSSNMVTKAGDTGKSFLDAIINFFKNLPYNIGYFLGSAIAFVINWNVNMVNKAIEMGTNFVNAVIKFFQELPGNISRFVTSAYQNVSIWAVNMWNKAKEMGSTFLSNVTSFFQQLPGKIKTHFDNAVEKAKEWVEEMARKGKEAVDKLITNFVEGAKAIPEKAKAIGKSFVEGVWNGIKDMGDWFKKNIGDFFKGILDGVKNGLTKDASATSSTSSVGTSMALQTANGFTSALPTAINSMQTALTDGVKSLATPEFGTSALVNISDFKDGLKDAYSNVVTWFASMESRLGESVSNMTDSLNTLIKAGNVIANSDGTLSYVGYNGYAPTNRKVEQFVDTTKTDNPSGGDTFVFYSQTKLSEAECALEFEKTKRKIDEGL